MLLLFHTYNLENRQADRAQQTMVRRNCKISPVKLRVEIEVRHCSTWFKSLALIRSLVSPAVQNVITCF